MKTAGVRGEAMRQQYRVRPHGIVHETIEGETVVLNLSTGTYFSLAGAAAVAWSRLLVGSDAADLGTTLRARYRGDPAAIDGAVDAFLAELAREDVIESFAAEGAPAEPAANGGSEPFEGLSLRRYTDIQELLLIDPVHEVDDTGWPARPDRV